MKFKYGHCFFSVILCFPLLNMQVYFLSVRKSCFELVHLLFFVLIVNVGGLFGYFNSSAFFAEPTSSSTSFFPFSFPFYSFNAKECDYFPCTPVPCYLRSPFFLSGKCSEVRFNTCLKPQQVHLFSSSFSFSAASSSRISVSRTECFLSLNQNFFFSTPHVLRSLPSLFSRRNASIYSKCRVSFMSPFFLPPSRLKKKQLAALTMAIGHSNNPPRNIYAARGSDGTVHTNMNTVENNSVKYDYDSSAAHNDSSITCSITNAPPLSSTTDISADDMLTEIIIKENVPNDAGEDFFSFEKIFADAIDTLLQLQLTAAQTERYAKYLPWVVHTYRNYVNNRRRTDRHNNNVNQKKEKKTPGKSIYEEEGKHDDGDQNLAEEKTVNKATPTGKDLVDMYKNIWDYKGSVNVYIKECEHEKETEENDEQKKETAKKKERKSNERDVTKKEEGMKYIGKAKTLFDLNKILDDLHEEIQKKEDIYLPDEKKPRKGKYETIFPTTEEMRKEIEKREERKKMEGRTVWLHTLESTISHIPKKQLLEETKLNLELSLQNLQPLDEGDFIGYIYANKIIVCLLLNKIREAVETSIVALRCSPAMGLVWWMLGESRRSARSLIEAKNAFEIAAHLDRSFYSSHLWILKPLDQLWNLARNDTQLLQQCIPSVIKKQIKQPTGIIIKGNDPSVGGCFIHYVIESSNAFSERVSPGDQIVALGNEVLLGKSAEECLEIFQNIADKTKHEREKNEENDHTTNTETYQTHTLHDSDYKDDLIKEKMQTEKAEINKHATGQSYASINTKSDDTKLLLQNNNFDNLNCTTYNIGFTNSSHIYNDDEFKENEVNKTHIYYLLKKMRRRPRSKRLSSADYMNFTFYSGSLLELYGLNAYKYIQKSDYLFNNAIGRGEEEEEKKVRMSSTKHNETYHMAMGKNVKEEESEKDSKRKEDADKEYKRKIILEGIGEFNAEKIELEDVDRNELSRMKRRQMQNM